MILKSIIETKKECDECNKFVEPEAIIKLNCKHYICNNCKPTKEEISVCLKCKNEKSNNDILKDLNTLDYLENNNVGGINCDIHECPIEYFSKSDKKFICMKCLYQFLEKPSDDIVNVNSKIITKDLFTIRSGLEKLIKDIDDISNRQENKSNFLSDLFYQSILYFNAMYKNCFEKQLDVFNVVFNNDFGKQSSIRNSKISFDDNKVIRELVGNSKIIERKEDDDFLKSLFESKFELALLFRASENNFSAKKFHEVCDNRGSTLCLFKSEQGRVFGGFSDKSWFSEITFKFSKKTFIFSIDLKKKMKTFRNFNRALFFSAQNGPCFGEDIIIGDKANEKKSCRSFLGRSYETCEGCYESYEAQKSLAGSPNFALKEYEVYQIKFII